MVTRIMPGNRSNALSNVRIRSILRCSITARCSASRADSFGCPRTISLARTAFSRPMDSTSSTMLGSASKAGWINRDGYYNSDIAV